MKRVKQFVSLTLMLIFPVCIIYFLRTFGENQFSIPIYHQDTAELASDICKFQKGQHHVPDFAFVDQDNQPISATYFDEHVTVVNFFYTNCNDICPEVNSELLRVQGNFYQNPSVRILSLTVDPEIDQPDVLARYAEINGAHSFQWNFATGKLAGIQELIRCGFILPLMDPGAVSAKDFMSNRLILVDSQRRIRGYYTGSDREEVDRLVTEVKILLKEEKF